MENIKITDITQHPQNPRKDLGDLTELADSIKAMGVMQNLTVVPCEDGKHPYTVIIGHRRLAASKMAGLETVPCQVVEMTEEQQIETMLMENMQRSDLTPIEEAEGFQMMLDLGKSIKDIKEATGLSETKIRHRVALNDLDKDTLKEKWESEQIRMSDLIKLEEIEDIEEKNKVLSFIGTNNFDWKLNSAIEKQEKEKLHKKILKKCPELADLVESEIAYWKTKEIFVIKKDEDIQAFIDMEKPNKTLYIYDSCKGYEIRTERDKVEEKQESEEEILQREKKDGAIKEIEKLTKQSTKLVFKYVVENDFELPGELVDDALSVALNSDVDLYTISEAIGHGSMDRWCNRAEKMKVIDEILDKFSMDKILALMSMSYASGTDTLVYDFVNGRSRMRYSESNDLKKLLVKAQQIGYKPSDTEMAIADGTHELYEVINEFYEQKKD